jgi:RNA polymerase subunit RPABC4/transcription elongation factor Spt4
MKDCSNCGMKMFVDYWKNHCPYCIRNPNFKDKWVPILPKIVEAKDV